MCSVFGGFCFAAGQQICKQSAFVIWCNFLRLYGHTVKSTVRRLFTWYFRFQNKCNRNTFAAVSRWLSGFYIKQIYKECHWTPFYPPITLRGREYYFTVVRMFLRAFSPKLVAETSVHRATHPTVTKMPIVKLCFNVLLHIFTKQFENEYSLWESNSNCKIDFICLRNVQLNA